MIQFKTLQYGKLQAHILDKGNVQDDIIIDDDSNDAITASISAVNNTNSSTRHIAKSLKKKRKKRYNVNSTHMKPIYNALKNYTDKLVNDGWFNKVNIKEEIPVMSSYSIMHSLQDRYQIVLYD